jgi:predicted permease
MNRIIEVLQTILPVAVMLCIGMICRSRHLISREGINALKNVAVNIALPAVLLSAFATTRYTVMDVVIPLMMFLVCVAAWAMGRAGARIFRLSSRFVPFLTTGFEAGMLGYALFNMLYGSSRTAEFARIDLGQVLFVFTLYKVLLGLEGKERADAGQLVKEMLLSPIIIAIAAGVLLGAAGIYQALVPSGISGIFDACTDFVSAPTSAIILLAIGYDLVFRDIPWISTGKVVLLRFGIMMILRFVFIAAVHLIWPQADLGSAVNVMFILPPPFVLPVFADDADQRVYVSSALSVSTLIAVIGFGVLAALGI